MSEPHEDESLLGQVIRLQDLLISFATGGGADGADYERLRSQLIHNSAVKEKLPAFVKECRNLNQLWAMIKERFGTYKERRAFLWDEFRPLIDELEFVGRSSATLHIGDALVSFDPEHVHVIWEKANARTTTDPEGAITAARTLVETVCKYILDDLNVPYADDIDLPKLWAVVAKALNLSPQQHDEPAFKAILGNVQSVVNYLGTIRNRFGDAHGRGRLPVKPKPRHAELAVNLAGSMVTFLIATWKERTSTND